MSTHLLADVHLRGADDPNAERLKAYLAGPAREAEALYVLGDLFDVWIGDDGSIPIHASILDAFAKLAATGVPLYFMRGNRDFAVGEGFVAASRMLILDDPVVVDLHGTPTLLSHGDMLCTDDTAHQAFRARYTNPRWRARMLRIPLWLRRWLAARARRKSTAGKASKPAHIMDVNGDTVRTTLREYGVTRLIHGHTHRPASHRVDLDGTQGERIVIADWRPEQAEILVADSQGVHRRSLIQDNSSV
ncbi:UDP-2,3-diacylglucosamine diphosphatase [Salinisphaera aquimarina]|uniref:UDP-2,3-diacylglucosamine hydrolase n=1 Tax=Salinisphaera aquimarina TaxID=2094031 RepID=A0ABV7ES61_9GAMM